MPKKISHSPHEGTFWFEPPFPLPPAPLHPSGNSSLASDFSEKMFAYNFFIKIYLSPEMSKDHCLYGVKQYYFCLNLPIL